MKTPGTTSDFKADGETPSEAAKAKHSLLKK